VRYPRFVRLTLSDGLSRALLDVAREERRNPRDQAALILEQALAHRIVTPPIDANLEIVPPRLTP
jgi:hypothetical protein